MKSYVALTGGLFGLLTLAHVWRATQEPHLAKDPWFLLFTAISLALGLWSARLLVFSRRS